mgnify:CR=1 FL=1
MPLIEAKPRSISQRHYFGLKTRIISTESAIAVPTKETIKKFTLPVYHWHPVASSNFRMFGTFSGNFAVGASHKLTFQNISIDERQNGYIEYIPTIKSFKVYQNGTYQVDVHLDLWLYNAVLRKLSTLELKLVKFSSYEINPVTTIHLQIIPMYVEINVGGPQRYFFPFACLQGSTIISANSDDLIYPVFNYQRLLEGTDIDPNDTFESYINFSLIQEAL